MNLFPVSLGAKAIKAPRRSKEGDESTDGDANSESEEDSAAIAKPKAATLSVDLLAKYGFDLKDQLGFFLWQERRFDFNSLRELRNSYGAAFGKDGRGWMSGPKYDFLFTLEAVRQVLVHRGGLVDERFRDRATKHPTLSKLKRGDRIELDGV